MQYVLQLPSLREIVVSYHLLNISASDHFDSLVSKLDIQLVLPISWREVGVLFTFN